jgi:Amt family ammonium transporter
MAGARMPWSQAPTQLSAMALTIVLSVVMTTVIAFVVKAVVGLRPSEEVEMAGLDLAEHGEEGYHATTTPVL